MKNVVNQIIELSLVSKCFQLDFWHCALKNLFAETMIDILFVSFIMADMSCNTSEFPIWRLNRTSEARSRHEVQGLWPRCVLVKVPRVPFTFVTSCDVRTRSLFYRSFIFSFTQTVENDAIYNEIWKKSEMYVPYYHEEIIDVVVVIVVVVLKETLFESQLILLIVTSNENSH